MDNDDYTYNDCYEHREIMKHHVTLMMRRGDKETLFPLKGGKVTPGAYDRYNCEEAKNLNRMMPIQPKKTKAHNQVPYLRSAPLQGVVEYLQDYMISPIAVKAKDMPSGDVAWNNFPSVLYTAHAVYCALEGLIHLISHTSFTWFYSLDFPHLIFFTWFSRFPHLIFFTWFFIMRSHDFLHLISYCSFIRFRIVPIVRQSIRSIALLLLRSVSLVNKKIWNTCRRET